MSPGVYDTEPYRGPVEITCDGCKTPLGTFELAQNEAVAPGGTWHFCSAVCLESVVKAWQRADEVAE